MYIRFHIKTSIHFLQSPYLKPVNTPHYSLMSVGYKKNKQQTRTATTRAEAINMYFYMHEFVYRKCATGRRELEGGRHVQLPCLS